SCTGGFAEPYPHRRQAKSCRGLGVRFACSRSRILSSHPLFRRGANLTSLAQLQHSASSWMVIFHAANDRSMRIEDEQTKLIPPPFQIGRVTLESPRQRDQVTLETGGFLGQFQIVVDLVKVAADAHQHAAWCNGREVVTLQLVFAVKQILDAIGLGPQFAAIENVDEIFLRGGLEPADEMAG